MVYLCKALVASDYTEVGLVNDRDTRNIGVRIRTCMGDSVQCLKLSECESRDGEEIRLSELVESE